MKRLHRFGGCALALVVAPQAWADGNKQKEPEPPFTLTIGSEAPSTFSKDSILPQITESDVENSVELAGTWGPFTGAYAVIDTSKGNGDQVGLGLESEKCLVFEQITCGVSVTFLHLPGENKRTYEAEITDEFTLGSIVPKWTLNASHEESESESDSIVSAELKLPIPILETGFTLNVAGGGAYSFDTTKTEGTFDVSIDYAFLERFTFNFGYKSVGSRNDQGEFEVKPKLVGSLAVTF